MSAWVKKLDEFINRQGIVSAELCIVVDNIENELKTLRSQIEKQKAINAEFMECVEFYGSADNWESRSPEKNFMTVIKCIKETDVDERGLKDFYTKVYGGKKARQTLARVKEMDKEDEKK
jgi:hypothetical protein